MLPIAGVLKCRASQLTDCAVPPVNFLVICLIVFEVYIMKISPLLLKHTFILFLSLILLSACKTSQKTVVVPEKKSWMPEISGGVQSKIAALEGSVDSTSDIEEMLQLSFLYTHKLNPKPNYEKSLELMNRYISKAPKDNLFEFAEYTQALLEHIKKQKRLLQRQKRLLRNEKKEKKLLIDKITSLKKLDIRLEKQRLGAE